MPINIPLSKMGVAIEHFKDANIDEYIDCYKNAIAKIGIYKISGSISSYKSKVDIDENSAIEYPEVILPSTAKIFILLILYHLGRNLPSDNIFNCSRTKSRLVRMIIHKKVIPILLRYKLSLPFSCPFHHERDVLWWPSLQVDFLDGHWVCPFCGMLFSSEEVVMDHWDKNHVRLQNEHSICLAKYCDIFRCEVVLAAMESENGKTSSNNLPNIYNHQKNLIPCDDKKMSALQRKCKLIMRNCLMDVLSSVSVKEFQDIEEEVNVAVCSYLTCQKYLDGSLQVVQPVPILVCVAIGALLIGGFCLCYYLIYTISHPVFYINNDPFCNGVSEPKGRIVRNYEHINGKRKNRSRHVYIQR